MGSCGFNVRNRECGRQTLDSKASESRFESGSLVTLESQRVGLSAARL